MIHGRDKGSRLTRFEVYTRIQQRTGKHLEILEPPPLPDELDYLWLQYTAIRKGCKRLTWREIDAYCRVTGCVLTPWETTLMLDLDLIRCHDNG